jgi:hypothetical protein
MQYFILFVDAKKVHKVCNDNNIQFGHIIKLLPGLEIVQMVGCSTSQNLDAALQSTISKPKKVKKVKNDKDLDTKIALHQTEVDGLSRKMDKLNAERRQMFAKYNIRSAKEKWNPVKGRELTAEEIQNHHRGTFNRVQNLKKTKRDNNCVQVQRVKEDLQTAKTALNSSRQKKTTGEPSFEDEEDSKVFTITKENYKCMAKAEDIRIDPSLLKSGQVYFCGTDNGFVKMTETVKVSLNVFKSALKSFLDQENPSWQSKDITINCFTNIILIAMYDRGSQY